MNRSHMCGKEKLFHGGDGEVIAFNFAAVWKSNWLLFCVVSWEQLMLLSLPKFVDRSKVTFVAFVFTFTRVWSLHWLGFCKMDQCKCRSTMNVFYPVAMWCVWRLGHGAVQDVCLRSEHTDNVTSLNVQFYFGKDTNRCRTNPRDSDRCFLSPLCLRISQWSQHVWGSSCSCKVVKSICGLWLLLWGVNEVLQVKCMQL